EAIVGVQNGSVTEATQDERTGACFHDGAETLIRPLQVECSLLELCGARIDSSLELVIGLPQGRLGGAALLGQLNVVQCAGRQGSDDLTVPGILLRIAVRRVALDGHDTDDGVSANGRRPDGRFRAAAGAGEHRSLRIGVVGTARHERSPLADDPLARRSGGGKRLGYTILAVIVAADTLAAMGGWIVAEQEKRVYRDDFPAGGLQDVTQLFTVPGADNFGGRFGDGMHPP